MILRWVCLLVWVGSTIGCSYNSKSPAINIVPKGYYSKAYQYGQWADGNRARLVKYIGKSEEEVKTDFGEPSWIEKDAILHSQTYDEEWGYHYSRGIFLVNQNTWILSFYFRGGVVAEVDVM